MSSKIYTKTNLNRIFKNTSNWEWVKHKICAVSVIYELLEQNSLMYPVCKKFGISESKRQ